jgi:hypothetical protein|tara:strand:+ start:43 stop:336 length:294 start_codon:yes stop_codon:yes gene_type:complete
MSLKKTNLRINNDFIVKDGNKYLLTTISEVKKFKKLTDEKLKKIDTIDVTKQIKLLMKQFEITSNINFLVDHDLHSKNKNIRKISLEKGGNLSQEGG